MQGRFLLGSGVLSWEGLPDTLRDTDRAFGRFVCYPLPPHWGLRAFHVFMDTSMVRRTGIYLSVQVYVLMLVARGYQRT
jgi:hypothetical protein